jgi:precorrin-2 dehydrogenase/sirohydrochlorin ferrochelatase
VPFDRYPVLISLSRRLVVVFGGTRAAERTAAAMAAHGADVVVITPDVSDSLTALEASGVLTVEPRGYVRGDLAGAFLAVSAADSPEIQVAIRDEAKTRGTLLNVLADADASDFTVPSVVRRGALQIAVSTGGIAPAAARRVRRELAAAYGPEWAVYVALLGAVRARAIERYGVGDWGLKPLFDSIEASDLLDRIKAGEDPTAEEVLEQHAASMEPSAADPS